MAAVFFALSIGAAPAEEFICEVMSVEGTVTLRNDQVSSYALKEGDLVRAGDWIETAEGAAADISYDRDWNNVTRIEENSKVQIRSVLPSSLELARGAVYAKLQSLPRDSSFEVKTPTAIAAVRGTEFRTVYGDSGSEIQNFSDSNVYVYGLDENGEMSPQHEPLIIQHNQKTQVVRRGEFGFRPLSMNPADQARGRKIQEHMDQRIHEFHKSGRVGRIQDLKRINARISDHIQKGGFKRPEDRFHGMKAKTFEPPRSHDGGTRQPGGDVPGPRGDKPGFRKPGDQNHEGKKPQNRVQKPAPPRQKK